MRFTKDCSSVTHLGLLAQPYAFAAEAPPSNPASRPGGDEEDNDPLYVYRQTLSAGAGSESDGDSVRRLFYAWAAQHRPLFRMCALGIHKVLPSLVLFTYLWSTRTRYSGFTRYLEMMYERRLGRGTNGFLAFLPAASQVGDEVVVASRGRVPLVLRRDEGGDDYYSLVGEA